MEQYRAAKPVRFDRTYEIGELIPTDVIDQRHVKRLVDSGKISLVVNSLGENREESVEIMEKMLGIVPDEGHDLNQRADRCKSVLDEIAVRFVKDQEQSLENNNNEGERSLDPEESQETKPDDFPDHICPECGKLCGSKSGLTQHLKTHSK